MKRGKEYYRVLLALDWYEYEINLGVAQFARQAGWVLNDIMAHKRGIPDDLSCDGIVALINDPRGEYANFVRTARVPVVDMVCEVPEIAIPRVMADNRAIGRLDAEHLISRGIRHLAFLNLAGSDVETQRMSGFVRAIQEAGREFHPLEFMRRPHQRTFARDIIQWLTLELRRLPQPLGVMVQFDGDAGYVLLAAEKAGLKVPEDMAVLGVDNDPIGCELGLVPLTSIDRRRRDHGYQAAALLHRLMEGATPPVKPVLVPPGSVVVRKSTDILAVREPAVVRAMRFIADHFHEPICVSDVVRASGTTRRWLYDAFEENIGRPIKAEIWRRRIACAIAKLSEDCQKKLYTVAIESGFRDEQHLSRVFKTQLGITPGSFRSGHGK